MKQINPYPDPITGAELQTLREACNLSRDELAALAGVAARTVKHWENGRAGVPADVAALVRKTDATIEERAYASLLELRADQSRRRSAGLPVPGAVALVRARTVEDWKALNDFPGHPGGQYAPGITWPATGGVVARLAALIAFDAGPDNTQRPPVRVVWFDPPSYAAWLQARREIHSGYQLQAWALAQVATQAIPHRADQPPA